MQASITPEFARLIERSFFACAGREANEQIARVRSERAAGLGRVQFARGVSYEVVLTGRPWRYVVDVVLPRLTYHLRCVHVARRSPQAVLPCFLGDTLFFVTVADLIEAVAAEEGWAETDIEERLARWERGEGYPSGDLLRS